jgi:hypothetical protein
MRKRSIITDGGGGVSLEAAVDHSFSLPLRLPCAVAATAARVRYSFARWSCYDFCRHEKRNSAARYDKSTYDANIFNLLPDTHAGIPDGSNFFLRGNVPFGPSES